MNADTIARQSITINAPIAQVWDALVDPDMVRQYLFGTTVISDWTEGSPIVWTGVWEGKPYEDKGVIQRVEPERVLQYTYFSPLSGVPDVPENYHTVTFELARDGDRTRLMLSQDNNPTAQAREHSEKNWATVLAALKQLLEQSDDHPAAQT